MTDVTVSFKIMCKCGEVLDDYKVEEDWKTGTTVHVDECKECAKINYDKGVEDAEEAV